MVGRLLKAAKQQNWHPQIFRSEAAYDGKLLGLVDPRAANGVTIPMPNSMFLGQDVDAIPAVSTFTACLSSWTSAQLFVEAMQKPARTRPKHRLLRH